MTLGADPRAQKVGSLTREVAGGATRGRPGLIAQSFSSACTLARPRVRAAGVYGIDVSLAGDDPHPLRYVRNVPVPGYVPHVPH